MLGKKDWHTVIIASNLNIRDNSLSVKWASTGLVVVRLDPALGHTWDVEYGRVDGQVRPGFISAEQLGRVRTSAEGVDLLRLRDLQER